MKKSAFMRTTALLAMICICTSLHSQNADTVQIPYCIGFEDSESYDWYVVGLTSPQVSTQNHRLGLKSLEFGNVNTGYSYAVLPFFDTDSLQELVMSFYAYATNAIPLASTLELGLLPDANGFSSFLPLDTLEFNCNYCWQQFTIDFALYHGLSGYVAFRFSASDSLSYCWVDDISVSRCAVDGLRVHYTQQGVTVQWNVHHTADSIILEYGPQGYRNTQNNQGWHIAVVSGGPQGSMALQYINQDSSYDVYVYSKCDDEVGCIPSMVTMNRRLMLPYCNDFEDYPAGATPDYWTVKRLTSQQYPVEICSMPDGSHSVCLYAGMNGGTMVMLPQLVSGQSLLGKSFNVRMSSESSRYTKFQVGVLTDTTNLLSFMLLSEVQNTADGITEEFNLVIPDTLVLPSGVQPVIRAVSTMGNQMMWLDRLSLSSSPFPLAIVDSAMGLHSHRISWQGGSDNDYFYVEYNLNDSVVSVQSDSCSVVLDGMRSGGEYDVYFVSIGGERLCFPYYFVHPVFYPVAASGSSVVADSCRFYVSFSNLSSVIIEDSSIDNSGLACDSAWWDFGNGITDTAYNAFFVYDSAGTYQVSLVSAVAGSEQRDTASIMLTLEFPATTAAIIGEYTICQGDTLTLMLNGGLNPEWYSDIGNMLGVADTLRYVPDNMSFVSCYFTDGNGCRDSLQQQVIIHPSYGFVDTLSLCADEFPIIWHDRNVTLQDTSSIVQLVGQTLMGCDSTVTLDMNVYQIYSFNDTVNICRDELPYTWCDTVFDVETYNGLYTRRMTSVDGCDSVRLLRLKINNVYNYNDIIESCEPYTWIDGVTYTERTIGPQIALQSHDGCDSILTLDFRQKSPARTNILDSICTGETYYFAGRNLTNGGLYRDTLETVEHCDSIITLILTKLQIPKITVTEEVDCERRVYNLVAQSDVDYIEWSCLNGSWNYDWGQPASHQVWVSPRVPTTLIITADYYSEHTCPATREYYIEPVKIPEARFSVSPDRLDNENDHFYAYDNSIGAIDRVWWVDGVFYGNDVRIVCTPPHGVDSVVVMLESLSEHCTDTAMMVIPVFHHSVYAPNAFTPDNANNSEFKLYMDGVVDYELFIYNRSGVLVFHSTDPEMGWDGSINGFACPQGTYVWLLKYTVAEYPRQPQTCTGSVLLLR
ncbi:MAG: gliding motility-associated C-terminal domain-containing protein [Bacteroidales bacterium]|nr:gliding motility-associated C-terminal domain-containing protein [Bacteroidales bacterium]